MQFSLPRRFFFSIFTRKNPPSFQRISSDATSFIFRCNFFIAAAAAAESLQSCPTLRDPIDSSPPGSPVPGILQARTLEWVAISFSNAWKWKLKVKSLSCVQLSALQADSLPTELWGKPLTQIRCLQTWFICNSCSIVSTLPSEVGPPFYYYQLKIYRSCLNVSILNREIVVIIGS